MIENIINQLLSLEEYKDLSEETIQKIKSLEFFPIGNAENLMGKRFDRWFVLGRGPGSTQGRSKITYWWVICSCPNHTITRTRASGLKNGESRSCGCLQREVAKITCAKTGKMLNQHRKDITGQRFGHLTAIEPTDRVNSKGSVIWKCKCDCGNIYYTSVNSLQGNKDTISCGCIKSKGEMKVKEILDILKIKYIQQKSFNTCRFPDTKFCAKFDFYLPDYNTIIEYNGIQHYQYSGKDWNTAEKLEYTKKHDKFKKDWCNENHIKFIEIPYTEYENLNEKYLEELLKG